MPDVQCAAMIEKEVRMDGSPRDGGPARAPDDRRRTPACPESASSNTAGSGDGAEDRPLVARPISRRAFLGGAASASALLSLRPDRLLTMAFPKARAPRPALRSVLHDGPIEELDLFVISAERPCDLVLLDFLFDGFQIDTTQSPPAIVPTRADNTVLVQFAPQAVGEANYPWQPEAAPNQDTFQLVVDPPPILSDLAGPSRLCFNLYYDAGGGSQTIPLPTMTVADLLDWSGWSLVVPPNAQAGVAPSIPQAPTVLQTAIEFPYALVIAPTVYAGDLPELDGFTTGFSARTTPLTSPAGIVDLWSTTLVGQQRGLIVQGATPPPPYVPQVAAVWATDYNGALAGPPVPSATPEQFIQYLEPAT
jgi:hypothetical protein